MELCSRTRPCHSIWRSGGGTRCLCLSRSQGRRVADARYLEELARNEQQSGDEVGVALAELEERDRVGHQGDNPLREDGRARHQQQQQQQQLHVRGWVRTVAAKEGMKRATASCVPSGQMTSFHVRETLA